MSQLFFLTIACIFGFVAAGPINGPCCFKKTVGNVSYTHVEQIDTSKFDCLSNCVYEQDGVLGSRFCFAHGELPVVCNGFGDDGLFFRDGIFWKDDKDLLDELKNHEYYPDFPDWLVRKHFMCCKGDPCLGSNCSSICGTSGKQLDCVLDVGLPELEDNNYCEDDGRPCDAVMSSSLRHRLDHDDAITRSTCGAKRKNKRCPTKTTDSTCICCKWPEYVQDISCAYDCLCKGVCEWFQSRGAKHTLCCTNCGIGCGFEGQNNVTLISISHNDSAASASYSNISYSHNSYPRNPYSRGNYYESSITDYLCTHINNPHKYMCPEALSMCCEADPTYFKIICPHLCNPSYNASAIAKTFPSVIFLSICFNVIFIKFL